jgi:hypothetical protein
MKLNDKKQLEVLRRAMQSALEAKAQELGVKFAVGRCTYDGGGNFCTFKVDINAVGEGGAIKTKEMVEFEQSADIYGLKAADLGRIFRSGVEDYKLVGLKGGRSKYPFLGQRVRDGKVFKLTRHSVISALLRSEGASAPHFHLQRRDQFNLPGEFDILTSETFATAAEALAEIEEAEKRQKAPAFESVERGVFRGCTCARFAGKEQGKKKAS